MTENQPRRPTVRQPPKRITALGLNKLGGSRRKQDLDERPDRDCAGLRVKVRASGRVTFRVGYRLEGKQQYYALGNWGDAGTDDHALAALRDRARAIQRLAKRGVDPKTHERQQDEARQAEEERRQKDSVRASAERYRRNHLSQLRTGEDVWGALEFHVLPAWGERPVGTITRREIGELVDGIFERGVPYMANRVHSYVSHFFSWCIEKGILDQSPAARSKRPFKNEEPRERVLTSDEIVALWRATEDGSPYSRLVRFLLASSARYGEASLARSSEIDAALWAIPTERSKNGEEHLLPLSRQALALLDAGRSSEDGLLFSYGRKPIGGRSKLKLALDRRMLAALKTLVQERGGEPDAVELMPWRLHDLRRTAATGMQAAGVLPHVISKVLNHKSATHGAAIVTAVYARYSYEKEMREAVAAWGERLERIITGLPVDDGKVVPMIRAAAP
jgi:integrase